MEITPEIYAKILYLYIHSDERSIIIESEEQLDKLLEDITRVR